MNVLIAEDEAPAARRLEMLVRNRLGSQLGLLEIAPSIAAARDALARSTVDLLLLDLNLHGADGFDLLSSDIRPLTIVVSARSDRAIDAFDHAVVDFVTKPVSTSRFALALDRALERDTLPPSGQSRIDRASLAVRSAGRIDLAAFTDIVSLSGADDYVEVTLADGRSLLHDARLGDLERLLPTSFVRVHRSHIVNSVHVQAIRKLPGRRRVLEMAGDSCIPVSRTRLDRLQDLIRS